MAKGPLRILIYFVAAVFGFLGLVFIVSVNLGYTYFFVGLVLLIIAGLILFASRERKPVEIKQTVAVTGPVTVREVRCPNCNASVDPAKAEVINGKPFVTCSYCGHKFELTEEPTW
jgi:DNA-directed RNA polymerase subunit RPC12/RpoP